jgi:hypothetical protein
VDLVSRVHDEEVSGDAIQGVARAFLLAGCATPAQRPTQAVFDDCQQRTGARRVWLEHVASDGQFSMRDHNLVERRAVEACMRQRGAVFTRDIRDAK